MKLILRQYLSDLRERGELDAVLPDLLSELGFTVLSRPGRGTRQAGVDVAAIGPDEDDAGRRKLFLFTIKPGDLQRRDWDDGTPQAIRPSLNEILDSYIETRIPKQHQDLEIAICICMGGEMKENVQVQWTGYVRQHSTAKICFREWNGDKLAGHMLSGVLKQELLDAPLQAYFQKSVAMVDHPDVAYRFFALLTQGLLEAGGNDRMRLTRLRQVYICLWVLFVWAREAGNLEAPFRASEYAVLHIWNECRPQLGKQTAEQDMRLTVLEQAIELHLVIADGLLMEKLGVYANRPFALSWAVGSPSAVDVNLALFEQLGRFSLYGLWLHWQASRHTQVVTAKAFADRRDQVLRTATTMINANPTLRSPIRDDFAIEIALFMLLAQVCRSTPAVSAYLDEMTERVKFSIERRGAYPVPKTDYHDLIGHPLDRSDGYFETHTRASVLYPLLFGWLDRLGLHDTRDLLASCIQKDLPHTTQQVWMPDGNTDEKFWTGDTEHGVGITGLPLSDGPARYHAFLDKALEDHSAFDGLSTTKSGLWPIFLMACRHYRLPVPPQLWFLGTQSRGSGEDVVEGDSVTD